MSEIKFRAWNGGAMEYGGFSVHATGEIVDISPLSKVKKNSPLMQYTGLKDQNGKEIYKGDIIKYISPDGVALPTDLKITAKVIYEDGAFKDGRTKTYVGWANWEVIGNIYQNPEKL